MGDFHRLRRTGIGGSDAAAVLGRSKWRTARDVWEEKTDTEKFAPQPRNPIFERGKRLEPVALQLYLEESGETVHSAQDLYRHPQHDFLMCHPDGLIVANAGDGVLEIKVLGMQTFGKILREGIPEDYLLQMQHNLMVTGKTWGEFFILQPERWQTLRVNVQADPTLQAQMEAAEVLFWEQHVRTRTPPPLTAVPLDLPAVTGTLQRRTDDAFDKALANYQQAKGLVIAARVILEEATADLKAALGGHGVYENAEARVYFTQQTRKSWDGKAVEKLIAQSGGTIDGYKKESAPFDTLRVYSLRGEDDGQD